MHFKISYYKFKNKSNKLFWLNGLVFFLVFLEKKYFIFKCNKNWAKFNLQRDVLIAFNFILLRVLYSFKICQVKIIHQTRQATKI